jgi:hypothetical protein
MPKRWDEKCPGDPVAVAIGAFMEDTIDEYGYFVSPRDVNAGMCDQLAEYVSDRIDGADDVRLIDEMFPGMADDEKDAFEDEHQSIIHHVIKHAGKFHDAESPCGVSSVEELPILKRFKKNNDKA